MSSESNKVTVKVLGCGDAFASGGRFNTCFYLHNEAHHFLVDCGASSLVSMKTYGIPREKIEAIILSHLHGDHFGGIPFYLLDAEYNLKRKNTLTIVGPEGTENRVRELTAVLYPGTDLDSFGFKIEYKEYKSGQQLKWGQLTIMPYEVIHSKPSNPHGLKIGIGNKTFSFSGDTEWTEALIDLAEGADLFICECNYYDKKAPNHLDYHTLLDRRERLKCKRMIVNHLGDEMLNRKQEIALECAEDGQEIIF